MSLWLPMTQGHMVNRQLSSFDNWPQGLEVKEGIWRDYYTGDQLENFTKPWENKPGKNCVSLYKTTNSGIWKLTSVVQFETKLCTDMFAPAWCPCQVDQARRYPPLLLRGLCSSSNLRSNDFTRGVRYTPRQLTSDFENIIYVGGMSTRIDYY